MRRTCARWRRAPLLALGSGGTLAQDSQAGWHRSTSAWSPSRRTTIATAAPRLRSIHPIAPHYSLLVKFDGKDYPKVVPDLAESWTVAPDGMTYTFKIRSGVKFHDGSPLTSEDIKASYDRIINPPTGVVSIRKAYYSDLVVEAPDPDHRRVQAEEPDGRRAGSAGLALQLHLQRRQAQAEPALSRNGDHGLRAPSRFVEHVKGTSWEGKRFEGYFDKGKPYLDGYKAYFVKSNAVVPGILGGQFDAEFRGRNPSRRRSCWTR